MISLMERRFKSPLASNSFERYLERITSNKFEATDWRNTGNRANIS